jgi:integrase
MQLPPIPKGVRRVIKRDEAGAVKAVYYYHRATGEKLPPPDAPNFSAAVAQAAVSSGPARTISDLIVEYKRSQEYRQWRVSTKTMYARLLDRIDEYVGAVAITDVMKRHILQIRDAAVDTPSMANKLVMMMRILMQFAVDREYRETNPADRIKRAKLGEHSRWSDDHIRYALANLPERYRRAIVLALYTGQRAGDLIAMRWDDYDGKSIRVLQQKTREPLKVRCGAELRRELMIWKTEGKGPTILLNAHGRPWQPYAFMTGFSDELRSNHRFLDGLVFHGLRKTAAAKLAEAGCSIKEIASITGHRSLHMIQHYTRQADQEMLAEAAILKMETRWKPEENSPATDCSDEVVRNQFEP